MSHYPGYPPSSYDPTRTYQSGMVGAYPPNTAVQTNFQRGNSQIMMTNPQMTNQMIMANQQQIMTNQQIINTMAMQPQMTMQPQVTVGYPAVSPVQRTVSVNTFPPQPLAVIPIQQSVPVIQPTMTVVHQHTSPQITKITHTSGVPSGTVQITKTTSTQSIQRPTVQKVVHHVIEEQEPPPKTMTITIEDVRTVNNEYTEYDVKIVSDLPQHGIEGYPLLVSKRYNDFLELHTVIAEQLGADARFLPDFPAKVWFGKFDPALIQHRKEQFQHLCTFISKEPKLRVSNTVDQFFGITHTRRIIKKANTADND